MANIKIRRTKKGITYHIRDVVNGRDFAKKVPARFLLEARKHLAAYEHEKMTKATPSLFVKSVPFTQLVEEYKEYSKHRKNESTYSKDLYILKILGDELKTTTAKDISAIKIQVLQSKWKQAGLNNKTINNRSVLLGTILKYGKELNYINEMPKIEKFKIDTKRPEFFTEHEMGQILSTATPLLRSYLTVLLYSGLRAGELKRLKLKDIDLKNKLIRVEISKGHRFRAIPISNSLYPEIVKIMKNKTDGQVYLFECNKGKPVSDLYHRFKKHLKSIGLEGHLHKLRHTFASWLVQNNVSIYEVQHLLGHASVQTTQRYAHIRMDNLKKAVDSLPETKVMGTKWERKEKNEDDKN